jgi:hypothetical protein
MEIDLLFTLTFIAVSMLRILGEIGYSLRMASSGMLRRGSQPSNLLNYSLKFSSSQLLITKVQMSLTVRPGANPFVEHILGIGTWSLNIRKRN